MTAMFENKLSGFQILTAVAVVSALQILFGKWTKAKRVARGMSSCPPTGAVTLFNPFRTISLVIGSFYPLQGQIANLFAKFSLYRKYGSTCLVSTRFWDATPTYWLADADAVKSVTSDRFTFTKDVEAYETLNIYGPSMIGLEGTEWKRHRDIAKTAFNEANNAFVWRETTRVVNEWFSQVDSTSTSNPPVVEIDLLRDLTLVTLHVIGSAGFGRRSPWVENANNLSTLDHRSTLNSAVKEAIHHLFPRILTPKPIWNVVTERNVYIPLLGPMLLRAWNAFEVLRGHMLDVASEARDRFVINRQKENDEGTDTSTHGAALLKNLVEANTNFEKGDEGGYRSMTDGELFSNMFLFYIAGHETTAHTLCFVFVYLALHPEFQQKVFEEAFKIYPHGVPVEVSSSSYKDSLPQLEYTAAVFHETLRLCPPVVRLAKLVQNDTMLKSKRFVMTSDGKVNVTQEIDVPVQKGGMCVMDILGLHMNPIHWGDDVEEFKPERFIDSPTRC